MKFTFWGVRGASPVPDTDKLRYGGNTSCVVITSKNDPNHFFILDAGTGLARFGSTLRLDQEYRATILLCHLHLYHIIGFQFTPFAFSPRCQTLVVGPNTRNFALESVFDHIMASSYSPVYGLENLMAQVNFEEATERPLLIQDMTIQAAPFNHNEDSHSWGYRLNNQRQILVYLTDAGLRLPSGRLDPEALRLVSGADALIAGAFDPAFDRPERTNYGDVLELARAANVKKIYFCHHHPQATDDYLDEVQAGVSHQNQDLDITLAYEGLEVEL